MAVTSSSSQGASDALWTLDPGAALAALDTRSNGLSPAEAATRLATYGPNALEGRKGSDALSLLAHQFASPIILILVLATIISGVLGDVTDTVIILAIIGLSGLLGFWQERGATRSV